MNKSFVIFSQDEIDFLMSCREGVLIGGLHKRFKSIKVIIKPLIQKLLSNGLIYKDNNVYLLTKKGREIVKNIR
jgi:predicted transcriptional regulator